MHDVEDHDPVLAIHNTATFRPIREQDYNKVVAAAGTSDLLVSGRSALAGTAVHRARADIRLPTFRLVAKAEPKGEAFPVR